MELIRQRLMRGDGTPEDEKRVLDAFVFIEDIARCRYYMRVLELNDVSDDEIPKHLVTLLIIPFTQLHALGNKALGTLPIFASLARMLCLYLLEDVRNSKRLFLVFVEALFRPYMGFYWLRYRIHRRLYFFHLILTTS